MKNKGKGKCKHDGKESKMHEKMEMKEKGKGKKK